jgi:hypothetical protein
MVRHRPLLPARRSSKRPVGLAANPAAPLI